MKNDDGGKASIKLTIVALIALCMFGCGSSNNSSTPAPMPAPASAPEPIPEPEPEPEPIPATQQSILTENIQKWSNHNLSDYQFTYKRICFCMPEEDIVIAVAGGKVSAAYFTPSGVYLNAERVSELPTITDLFDQVQEAIDDSVFFLEVSYDEQLGYPTRISIDHDEMIADDEVTFIVSDLQ